MQNRKNGIISLLLVCSIMSVAGCTTTWLDMKSWEGRTVNDLYFELGKADEVENTKANERVHTWISTRSVDGEVKTCRKSFYARNTGNEEVITRTSYSGCHFFTLK